jgi:hypothetical protein
MVICIMHLNKAQIMQAIYRVSGSVAFTAVPRAVFGIAYNPNEDAVMMAENRTYVLVNIKPSYGVRQKSLQYKIEQEVGGHEQAIRVKWLGPIDVGAETVFGVVPTKGRAIRRNDAAEFLNGFLSSGPKLQKAVYAAGEAQDFAQATLRRAANGLGIESYKGKGTKDAPWYWKLPANGGDPQREQRLKLVEKMRPKNPSRKLEGDERDTTR